MVLASVSDLIISVSGHLQVVTSTGETELTLLVSALGSAGSGGRGGRSGGANVSTGLGGGFSDGKGIDPRSKLRDVEVFVSREQGSDTSVDEGVVPWVTVTVCGTEVL